MAIHEMSDTELVQRCAKCGREDRIALAVLEVGLARDEQVDASILPLPPCASCRSTEYLLRSSEDERTHAVPGSFGHLHRMLVDHAHAELVKRGRVIPALKDQDGRTVMALARPLSDDEVRRWFPEGFRIEMRPEEGPPEPTR